MNRLKLVLLYPMLIAAFLLGFTWVNIAYAAPVPQGQRLGGGVVINEILPDPSIGSDANCILGEPSAPGYDTNRDGCVEQEDEFVELYNMSAQEINIGGWQLWTKGEDNWFTFTQGTKIQPGGYVVVVAKLNGGTLPGVPANTVFSAEEGKVFANNGDNVVLLDPVNKQFIQIKYTGVITPEETHDPPAPTSGYKNFPADAVRVGLTDFTQSTNGYSIERLLPGDTRIITQGQYISPGATPGTYLAVEMQSSAAQAPLPLPYVLWLATAVLLSGTTHVWWQARRQRP